MNNQQVNNLIQILIRNNLNLTHYEKVIMKAMISVAVVMCWWVFLIFFFSLRFQLAYAVL
jgi:hypothetical protein